MKKGPKSGPRRSRGADFPPTHRLFLRRFAVGDSQGQSTLLVIDVQNAVVAESVDVAGVIGRINDLLRRARDGGAPVVFVQHEDAGDPTLARGSPGWRIEVLPASEVTF